MFCTQAPKQIWEEYREAGSWVRLPQRVMEGACEGKRKASEERQKRVTRKGAVFLRFARGAFLVFHDRFALAFASPKNAKKKITPVMQARFMVNVVRNSWRFLRQMNLQCRPYCCSS